MMELNINGNMETVGDNTAVMDNVMLLWTLRDELGLTGTKFGCGVGICGACTVLVDGQAMRACVTPLAAVTGKEIRTIEGLATTDSSGTRTLHPVQQAFIDQQVPQCGWCMSGQIMQAAAFLQQNPTPRDEEIVEAMSNNYCRCGCYVRIKAAVVAAAQRQASQAQSSQAQSSQSPSDQPQMQAVSA